MSSQIPHIQNWEGSIDLLPSVIVKPRNIDELINIVKNNQKYPSPLRPSGSRHSTTKCAVADGGTLVDMRNMNKIIEINENTVRVEAGCLFIDVAQELRKCGMQFYVNVEIGNISMGSAATCGTKDASFYGEFGQMASYIEEVKMINGKGEIITINESSPDDLQAVRSSYGLYGIVFEVTIKIKKIQSLKVYHKTYSIEEFEFIHPQLCKSEESLMFYLFPFEDKITIEYRSYLDRDICFFRNPFIWKFRNFVWKKFAPAVGYLLTSFIPCKKIAYRGVDVLNKIIRACLDKVICSKNTYANDQIIRYPEEKGISKYTFSIWAFPEEGYPKILKAYFDFCKEYYRNTGYRCNILNVGYRISKDQNPLFSYSYDGHVMTADPVATGGKGWDDFLKAYNDFCSEFDGIPMFNQSKHLNRKLVKGAFGERIETFKKIRLKFDSDNRFLNEYFKQLFDI
ncbi:MAG: FAD-dependent oxidoreductase [Bacteroidales bacterium]